VAADDSEIDIAAALGAEREASTALVEKQTKRSWSPN
jgi:hypothetical protein